MTPAEIKQAAQVAAKWRAMGLITMTQPPKLEPGQPRKYVESRNPMGRKSKYKFPYRLSAESHRDYMRLWREERRKRGKEVSYCKPKTGLSVKKLGWGVYESRLAKIHRAGVKTWAEYEQLVAK